MQDRTESSEGAKTVIGPDQGESKGEERPRTAAESSWKPKSESTGNNIAAACSSGWSPPGDGAGDGEGEAAARETMRRRSAEERPRK